MANWDPSVKEFFQKYSIRKLGEMKIGETYWTTIDGPFEFLQETRTAAELCRLQGVDDTDQDDSKPCWFHVRDKWHSTRWWSVSHLNLEGIGETPYLIFHSEVLYRAHRELLFSFHPNNHGV